MLPVVDFDAIDVEVRQFEISSVGACEQFLDAARLVRGGGEQLNRILIAGCALQPFLGGGEARSRELACGRRRRHIILRTWPGAGGCVLLVHGRGGGGHRCDGRGSSNLRGRRRPGRRHRCCHRVGCKLRRGLRGAAIVAWAAGTDAIGGTPAACAMCCCAGAAASGEAIAGVARAGTGAGAAPKGSDIGFPGATAAGCAAAALIAAVCTGAGADGGSRYRGPAPGPAPPPLRPLPGRFWICSSGRGRTRSRGWRD